MNPGNLSLELLESWLFQLACHIADEHEAEPEQIPSFLQDGALCLHLLDMIDALPEDNHDEENEDPYYSACIFALDLCVAQLQSASQSGQKLADRILTHFMEHFANLMRQNHHSLGFWLPFLNAFYEANLDFSPELREAYFELAALDESVDSDEEIDNMHIIQNMLSELAEFSIFDIADNFFAQTHGMPPEFFPEFIADLCNLPEAQEIAILSLLHPKAEIREIVFNTLAELMSGLTLSNIALTRLKAIKPWYPEDMQETFQHWIKIQRMKEVVFHKIEGKTVVKIHASEVDGSGAQGIFIHLKNGRKHRIAGLLFKLNLGLKDSWLTPFLTAAELKKYYRESFHGTITLYEVDIDYLKLMTEHFLAETISHKHTPGLHFLEIQEELGCAFTPKPISVQECIDALSIQISPFTEDSIRASFKRSKAWLKNHAFTESWYIENANVDKLVNRCSRIVDGVKICSSEKAVATVFEEEIEAHRDQWLFHFLWISLWLKASVAKNHPDWQDSFMIAYAIFTQKPLKSIPVLQEIVNQTVLNSIETMNERRTHLNKE